MEEKLTINQVLNITIDILEGIDVPVKKLETIGVPIKRAVGNLLLCIQAGEKSEAANGTEPQDECTEPSEMVFDSNDCEETQIHPHE